MSVTATLTVLYDTDAVEVRYSDGSRLELSPCGATMIFQPAVKSGEHPRKGISSRVHKRTCFVTSEHKQFVLQALDFRNRFAARPYLCEELIENQNLVTLYASIHTVQWPTSESNAPVEILEDGSRKVTSLDDFARLIVSPHSQDFSVSYLSRISSDDRSNNSSKQYLHSSILSPSKLSECTECGGSLNEENNEAVVQPFQRMSLEDCTTSQRGTSTTSEPNNNTNFQKSSNKVEFLPNGQMKVYDNDDNNNNNNNNNNSNQIGNLGCSDSVLDDTLTQVVDKETSIASHKSDVCDDDKNNDILEEIHQRNTEKYDNYTYHFNYQIEREAFMGSPVSHDISSISRSSTPDCLRRTIDSDATLIHENIDFETATSNPNWGSRNTYYHRHSSPTHISGPCNIDLQFTNPKPSPLAKSDKKEHFKDDSFYENERLPPVGIDSNTEKELNKDFSNPSLKKDNYPNVQNQQASLIPSTKHTQNVIAESSSFPQTISSRRDHCQDDFIPISHESPSERRLRQKCKCTPRSHHNSVELANQTKMSQPSHHPHPSECSPRPLNSVTEEGQDQETAVRKKYVWITLHASRHSCPKEWTHPLMLALKHGSIDEKSSKGKVKTCPVPKALPLCCPFQHKHRMFRNPETFANDLSSSIGNESLLFIDKSISEFQQGRLKVVMSEGIIYRLVSSNSMTLVEIYPGDGTVLVSQGVKAIFFTHFIPRKDILEERTYSLKSLPRQCSKGHHSIEMMMKTANRLVGMCLNWEKMNGDVKAPCWKKEVVAVVEPLSSALLEECFVKDLGRFSAFTNGRVRILFEDRTALDMTADFTQRIGNEMDHHLKSLYKNEGGNSTARLLVPSGNYVTVEIYKPGPYANYVRAAKEWVSWVNCDVAQRHEFYRQMYQPHVLQQAAELELKKIFCFNYIVEHTAALNPSNDNASSPNQSSTTSTSTVQPHELSDSNFRQKSLPLSISKSTPFGIKLPSTSTSVNTAQRRNPYAIKQNSSPHQNQNSFSPPASIIKPTKSQSTTTTAGLLPCPEGYNSSTLIHQRCVGQSESISQISQPSLLNYIPFPSTSTPHNSHHTSHIRPNSSQIRQIPLSSRSMHQSYFPSPPNQTTLPYYSSCVPSLVEDRCVPTSMGLQSVRSALARTSSLINDIEMFLEEENRK